MNPKLQVKHTPGPWWIDEDNCIAAGGGDDYTTICEVLLQSDNYKTLGNARLIRSAPDLYAVLKEVLPYFEGEYSADHPTLLAIQAAILKAEGGK